MFAELFGEYTTADDDTRRLLERELPRLLARASPLGRALRGCPDERGGGILPELETGWRRRGRTPRWPGGCSCARDHPDVVGPADAQRGAGRPRSSRFAEWSRRDLGALAQSMDNDAELAQAFRTWRKARRGEPARKLLGRAGQPTPGDMTGSRTDGIAVRVAHLLRHRALSGLPGLCRADRRDIGLRRLLGSGCRSRTSSAWDASWSPGPPRCPARRVDRRCPRTPTPRYFSISTGPRWPTPITRCGSPTGSAGSSGSAAAASWRRPSAVTGPS